MINRCYSLSYCIYGIWLLGQLLSWIDRCWPWIVALGGDISRKRDFKVWNGKRAWRIWRLSESQCVWSVTYSEFSSLLFSEQSPYFYTFMSLILQFSSPGVSFCAPGPSLPAYHNLNIIYHGPYWIWSF